MVSRRHDNGVKYYRQKHAEEALHQAQVDLAHVSRVTTMRELCASLPHELNQPIAAALTDANTCLRWLTRDHPEVEEARAAASRIVKDATRAAANITRRIACSSSTIILSKRSISYFRF